VELSDALAAAVAAAEADREYCTAEDKGNDGGLGFTKLSDELLCYNVTILNNIQTIYFKQYSNNLK